MKIRTLKILRTLLNADYPIHLESLATDYNVSSRTIRNDIDEINKFLLDHNLKCIKNVRNKGVIFSGTAEQITLINNLLSVNIENSYMSPDERILDILLSITLGSEKVFAYQKEKELQVSKSTIDEDMRQLRTLLESYDLKIVSNANRGFSIVGNEHLLRFLLINTIGSKLNTSKSIININESVIYKRVIHKYLPYNLVEKIYNIYSETFITPEDNIYKFNQILFVLVSIIRIKHGNYVDSNDYTNLIIDESYLNFTKKFMKNYQLKYITVN